MSLLQNNTEFIEKMMTRAMIESPHFVSLIATAFDRAFFESPEAAEIYTIVADHYKEYKKIPTHDTIVAASEKSSDVSEYMKDAKAIDIDVASRMDFIVAETDHWLKEAAIKKAIVDSIEIVESGDRERLNQVMEYVRSALCKTIKMDLGLDYFNTLGARLKRMIEATDNYVPTYFPTFDEYITGGFRPFTLSVGLGRIHGNKSGTMLNMLSRQVRHGHNVAMFTLEMSEDAMAQRIDALYSKLDINQIYTSSKKDNLIKALKDIRDEEGRGDLFVKQFPTGTATTAHFRAHLYELDIRGFVPDIVYCDYVNLMKPEYQSKGSMYEDVKRISEELRAMSFEFEVPIVSVTQLNRDGSRINFSDVDFTYVSESQGLPATADFCWVLGVDENKMTYANELHYKITKNRMGGRVGETDKFYFDPRSLKLYDPCELDEWMKDALRTGCVERKLYGEET